MTQSIEQRAAGLTEPMRLALIHQANGRHFWCSDGRTTKALQRKGFIGTLNYAGCADWLPLGLAVQKHLQEQTDEG